MRYLGQRLGSRKGAVLIVVLGVLFILALLATTFATLQATEKQVARNYLDMVRAKLIAQSGAQDADARLREYFPSRYFESVMNGSPQAWKFWGQDILEVTEPSILTRKLEDARSPSFAVEVTGNNPTGSVEVPQNPENPEFTAKNIMIDGKLLGFSGAHGSGTYANHGDQYSLKVTDLSGRIYVNDGMELDKKPGSKTKTDYGSVSQNLWRMLDVLGSVVGVTNFGQMVVTTRPVGGYRHPQDLLRAVGYDEVMYNKVKDHVTVFAWQDPNVCLPVPLSAGMVNVPGSPYPVTYFRGTPPVYRMGSTKNAAGQEMIKTAPGGGAFSLISDLMTCPTACGGSGSALKAHEVNEIKVYGLDTLNPQYIEIVARAPVNINSASREVLVALLTDIRGFYCGDRRRNNPRWEGELYLSFKQSNSLSPAYTEGDEYGYLMETVAIQGPGGSATSGISAFEIADEIIACRSFKQFKGHDYSSKDKLPFAGPFRSWYQFDAFIDFLATPTTEKLPYANVNGAGLIVDNGDHHVDYPTVTPDPTGYSDTKVPSDQQKRQAARACADAIKSNFNPNLQLNEINPDMNTFKLVDKTDLFVNSTEFSFLPTGHFEVESLGRVLRGADGVTDVYLPGNHKLVAQAKVVVNYKFYELYRETTQKQFHGGVCDPATQADQFSTNNGRSLEVGPEVDNGRAPRENDYAGYIQLPTLGSVYHSAPLKAKDATLQTMRLQQAPQFNAAMHSHFTLDLDAHHHIVDAREIASRRGLPDENVDNHPDLNLNYPGPYDPTRGGNASPHRIAYGFKQDPPKASGSGTGSGPLAKKLTKFAPSDLRIDGAYSERHASPAYYTRMGANAIWNFSQENASGMVSMWFKPSYFPQLTGKVRQVWDLGRFHTPCNQKVHVWPFQMIFLPAHSNIAQAEGTTPLYWANNMGHFHPNSMYFGSKQWHGDVITGDPLPAGYAFGRLTKSLNHMGHGSVAPCIQDSPDGKYNVMIGHRWVHATFGWTMNGSWAPAAGNSGPSKMWLNGSDINIPFTQTTMNTWDEGGSKMLGFEYHAGGEFNHMRLGAPSQICNAAKLTPAEGVSGAFRGNHTADFTVDEFYVWKAEADAVSPQLTWNVGRYYKPDAKYDGKFTSQAIALLQTATPPRQLPPPSAVAAPGSTGSAPGGSVAATPAQVRILGVSWSWYGEGISPPANPGDDVMPAIFDYNEAITGNVGYRDLKPRIRVTGILADGLVHPTDAPPPGKTNDVYARVRHFNDANGGPAVIKDAKNIQYQLQFELLDVKANTILVTTPILDDVTLFWDDGRSHMLSYTFDSRAF